MDFDITQWTEFFEYLDELRESGETNMFGARPYVQEEFGLDKTQAAVVLKEWMASFDSTTPASDRALAAFDKASA